MTYIVGTLSPGMPGGHHTDRSSATISADRFEIRAGVLDFFDTRGKIFSAYSVGHWISVVEKDDN
jgi:hypothetical protein